MASSAALFIILLGGFFIAMGYEGVSACLGTVSNTDWCWTPSYRSLGSPYGYALPNGALSLYLGAGLLIGGLAIALISRHYR